MKIELENAVVYQGSNLDVLPTLPDNSVDSIVTDPPYELGFMGKSWDNSGIAYSVELWTECMRVLKPGGHLLAFGGSRTWHRLAVAIEDAGFEMRDSIAWLYGSGFPKSMDISKQIDKQAGAEREVIGTKLDQPGYSLAESKGNNIYSGGFGGSGDPVKESEITAPATDKAKKWQGWGTALKPAFEPVVVARKPLEEKTVAANVLKYGTGGLNIDGSRIGTETLGGGTMPDLRDVGQMSKEATGIDKLSFGQNPRPANRIEQATYTGRWPANIILDPYTAELLDEQSGDRPGGTFPSKRGQSVNTSFASGQETVGGQRSMGDSGGASRFFYVAKASKKDRNEGDANNIHPTVKPTTLMEYLIKLVTPPNGTVLDPFTGSGSTGKAALLNNFKFIGIELTEEYLPIIEGRLKWASEQASKKEEEKSEVLF